MNNKIKMFIASVSSLSLIFMLTGCGGGNDKVKTPELTGAEAFVEGTHPRFDPVTSDIPFNTDLLFANAATSDGTADAGAPTNSIVATLNALDGFSTSAFFDVMVSGSVDPATVVAMQTVFLLQVDTGTNDALNPANIVGLKSPATFDAKVVSLDGGTNNVIRIRPTLPLKSKAKYLVFLTNDIKDAAGKALTRSWSYNSLHDTTFTQSEALVPVRNAIIGWEALASGFLKAVNTSLTTATALDKLVLTYTFTTTDPQAPLIAMAAPRAALVSGLAASGVPLNTAVGMVGQLEAGGLLPTPKQRPLKVSPATGIDMGTLSGNLLASSVGKLYTGYIKLPYYQTAPGSLPFAAFLTKNWTPDLTLASALNKAIPTDVDKTTYNMTYRYPFAAKTTDESVPLQITLPEKTVVPGYAGALNCGQIYAANGYPTVIYVHGITSDRSSVLVLAHTMASRCIATVAIDLPLHGVAANNALAGVLNVEHSQMIPFSLLYGADAPHERHFNVSGAGGAPAPMNWSGTPTANDGSGVHFTNLGYLINTRDNNREAVIDLLNLNASLAGINDDLMLALSAKLDLNNVNVVGISLGGILSTVFVAVNQVAIASDANVGGSHLNSIHSLAASAAGTQVAQVLVNSASFAPVINAGLAASGVQVGTSNYEKFMYAAQSAVDSGDPVNFAQLLSTLHVPVFVQQVNGDLVVPNSAASAPLTGTQALVRLLGATQLGLGQTQLGLGYVKMNAGDHVSLLRPTTQAPQVTAEMQAQVVSFVLGAGKVAVGSGAPANVELPAN